MNASRLERLAEQLQCGELSPREFARLAGAESGVATMANHAVALDVARRERCGFPEVVFGEGKTTAAIAAIFRELVARGDEAFVTRVSQTQARDLTAEFPEARYNAVARTLRLAPGELPPADRGAVAVITAGTSDRPVAEEARETLDWMRVRAVTADDVGVAGPHRLPERLADIQGVDAVVVIAGMEGALPSVVGGYVPCPVIGVPTSVGYGANFAGLSALLSMLNSCASNVAVVNIDAGFKGGYLAGLVATRAAHSRREAADA